MDLFMKLFQSPPSNVVIDPALAGTEIDDSKFPYVIVKMQSYYINSRQVRYFLTAMGNLYKRAIKENQRFVLILDTRNLVYSKWNFVYELAKWFLSVRTTTSRYILCTIILSENVSFQKFVKNWLFTFVKRTRPNYICSTTEEGWIWLILYLHSQAQAGTLHEKVNRMI